MRVGSARGESSTVSLGPGFDAGNSRCPPPPRFVGQGHVMGRPSTHAERGFVGWEGFATKELMNST